MWPTWAYFVSDECDYLDLISEQLEFSSRPFSDFVAAALESRHQGRIGPLSQLVLPALLQCRTASERDRARVRCLRVLNAAQSRADQPRQSKLKITELGLTADATTDPFTGTPLRLRRTTAGWLVYSVGENRQDDGGDLNGLRDIGVGPNRPSPDGQ